MFERVVTSTLIWDKHKILTPPSIATNFFLNNNLQMKKKNYKFPKNNHTNKQKNKQRQSIQIHRPLLSHIDRCAELTNTKID